MGYDYDFIGAYKPFAEMVYFCLFYNFGQHGSMRRQTPTAGFPIEIATFFVSLIFSFCHESIAKSFSRIRLSAGRRKLPG